MSVKIFIQAADARVFTDMLIWHITCTCTINDKHGDLNVSTLLAGNQKGIWPVK